MSLYSLEIALGFSAPSRAATALRAVEPELNAGHARRSSTSVKVKNNTLLIDIKADDATALRASANSVMNSIILSKNLTEV